VKILMAASCSSNPNLGVPGVMHSLAQEYSKLGHEVRFRFRDEPGRLAEMLFGWRLSRSEETRWADVVDCHAVEAWPLCIGKDRPAVVARSHGLELVLHRRLRREARAGNAKIGPLYWTYRGSARLWLERQSIRRSDASIILNSGDLEICRREFKAPSARLHLVPNGYPAAFLDAPLRFRATDGIAFVGSWLPRKGCDIAAAAISSLLRKRPGLRVLLAGTGVAPDVLLGDFPEDTRSGIQVVPKFSREELPDLLEGSGILLFPSRSEGSPLSLVEAMACGICPVASAIPGVVDAVRSGENGILFPPEDTAALEREVDRLLDDRNRLQTLRISARESVRGTSWKQQALRQIDLYRDILDGNRSRS
jgi:glycosyltransferase involved in cell wall biosynthesis